MKKILLLAGACLLFTSGATWGAIVYSGSQDVMLRLSPMSPMGMDSRTIHIAGGDADWDAFQIDLSLTGAMGMDMAMGTRLVIFAPGSMVGGPMGMGMGMGGIVGIRDLASNLPFGSMIGPTSPLTNDGWALLTGSGEFHEAGGYIGLMLTDPAGAIHYGWLQMAWQTGIGTDEQTAMFNRWAYQTQPGAPIDAGVVPVPGAVGLGLLGVGAVGLVRARLKGRA